MRSLFTIPVFIFTSAISIAEDKVTDKDIFFKGISLRSTIKEVTTALGQPIKIVNNDWHAWQPEFYYLGLHIGFLDGEVDYIEISEPIGSLSNGMAVGNPYKNGLPKSFTINDSDCYLQLKVNMEVISEIEILCAL